MFLSFCFPAQIKYQTIAAVKTSITATNITANHVKEIMLESLKAYTATATPNTSDGTMKPKNELSDCLTKTVSFIVCIFGKSKFTNNPNTPEKMLNNNGIKSIIKNPIIPN